MAYKTIITAGSRYEEDKGVLEAAIEMATREGAHLDVLSLGIELSDPALYYAGPSALLVQQNYDTARQTAVDFEAAALARLQAETLPNAVMPYTVPVGGLPNLMEDRGRMADLAILARPYGDLRGAADEALLEAALYSAQIPVITVADGQAWPAAFNSVVIAWNESFEALRAIRAAMPILQGARRVEVVIVDPPRHRAETADPGGELAVMLSRHGVTAEVTLMSGSSPSVANALTGHCGERGADLLVLGAYGHSRFRETILGGVTRDLLENATMPLFLKH